jgi:deoxyribodipyrimidine photolyase-related protein
MGKTLRFILGDQLSRDIATLRDLDPARDVVALAEVAGEATYVRHHPKKIAFVFSAMRHFAASLRAEGIEVDYLALDAPDNPGRFAGAVRRAVERHAPTRVVVTEPGEWRVWRDLSTWEQELGLPVQVRDDDRFFTTPSAFRAWAEGRKLLRMEHFYRDMRRRTGFLMEPDGRPVGGKWNYDAENREALSGDVSVPDRFAVAPDAVTAEVLDLVASRFGDHFGSLDGFDYAVTAADAGAALQYFVAKLLPRFGDYQDAMRVGEPFLFHARISVYLNAGLLDPRTVCRTVERAYWDGHAPLNAVEGFIRQILGWREFIRGIYWLKMPDYADTNALSAKRALPTFYWTGETDLRCLREVIGQTRREAYAHHIQRLMVTGNFALIAGLSPAAVNEWYMVVYADAYEWVELPNVQGMALFADGGVLASKPYAASGKYIARMSNYCQHCRYNVQKQLTEDACPLNALYWNFIAENREAFEGNPRMAMPLRTLSRMSPEKVAALREKATRFLDSLDETEPGTWRDTR